MIDTREQKVRLLEVESGGFLGMGETKVLIPVDAITRITDQDVYINDTREHVAGAPRYVSALIKVEPSKYVGIVCLATSGPGASTCSTGYTTPNVMASPCSPSRATLSTTSSACTISRMWISISSSWMSPSSRSA